MRSIFRSVNVLINVVSNSVSSAIVQHYLNHILEAVLSPFSKIQPSVVNILSFTVKQGLSHPLLIGSCLAVHVVLVALSIILQSFSTIVALETLPVSSLSDRVVVLHTILLHMLHRHASLLNSGFIVACRKSYKSK